MAAFGFVVLFVTILTVVAYWYMRFRKLKQMVDKIQGPRAFPILGNVHQIKHNPDDWLEQTAGISMMYKNPRMLRAWLLWFPYIIIFGAEEAEVILSSNKHINKGREYQILHPWLGLGLLTNYAEAWRPRRKLLTPTFHYDILKDFMDVFNGQSRVLVRKLEETVGKGTFDMYPYVTMCALDIICETAMGKDIAAQDNKDSDYVKAIYLINDIIHERQKKPWLWAKPIFHLIGRGKQHSWCLNVIHSFTKKVISERQEEVKKSGGVANLVNTNGGGKRRLAFLDLLLDMVEQGKLPMEDVRAEVDTFMFEGHDTTSAGMNWVLHLIGCYPEIQAKVHNELYQVFGDEDRDVGYEDMKNLTYLECCVKEALRLFPSVPMFTRTVSEDCDVVGFTIPAGTQVMISPYAVHRDQKHWPDPEMFVPERFLPENSVGRHPYSFLPFSAGSRNCIGQRFAIMEEKTVLAWILRYYKVTSTQRRDQVRPKAELILRPSQGCQLTLEPRRKLPPLNADESM